MVCLDTCFLIDFLREQRSGKQGVASNKFNELQDHGETPKTTTINLAELYFGAYYTRSDRVLHQIGTIVHQLEILTLTVDTAKRSASIAANLKLAGETIGFTDVLIASIVMEAGETLVTRNVKHFSRILGLEVDAY